MVVAATPTPAPRRAPAPEGGDPLSRVRALYDEGQYLKSWAAAAPLGDPRRLRGTRERILVARIASQLGAPRLARFLALTAWRADPRDAEALYYRASSLQHRGPLEVLRFLWAARPVEDAPAEARANLLLLEASMLAALRDFAAAEAAHARAEALAPDRAWAHVEKAYLLERQDRTEEALVYARRALEVRPDYRPGVQMLAHTLVQHGRDAEALALLEDAAPRLESGAVCLALAGLLRELGRPRESLRWVERAVELSPLAERGSFEDLAAQLSDAHYDSGDVTRAIECAELVGKGFFETIARRMAEPKDLRRVELPVQWVRQNHLTCAPATLTSIARMWGMPADHLQVAEAICYDGTPSHSERRWAEENGWCTRAFTVTWESAVALLDRGVAFTLATTAVGASHLQAVIGYDARRGTLLVRDPGVRWRIEMDAPAMLERFASTGPRGMAMVPRAHASLLDGLELPDARLHDLTDAVESALQRHDRAAAADACLSLELEAPGHRLALLGRRALAAYDANTAVALAVAERLVEKYPKDPVALLDHLTLLGAVGRRPERTARLRQIVEGGAPDPFFWRELAVELRGDARHHSERRFLLQRFVRHRAGHAAGYSGLADLHWELDHREEALRLYRITACLAERDESSASSYYQACVHLRAREEGLDFLRDRFRRFGHKSSGPARTLFEALEAAGRTDEAFRVLDEAMALQPDDGELLLFAAECFRRAAMQERAADALAAARGKARPGELLRADAARAEAMGDLTLALAKWQGVLELEPLAMDAHAAVAHHLAGAEGAEAALDHLERACARFAHHQPLHQLWISWLRDHDLARREQALQHLVDVHPSDAWARRERALVYSVTGRPEEALAELEVARSLDPLSPSFHNTTAIVLGRLGRVAEAREAWRQSLRRDVDQPLAIDSLIGSCTSRAERAAALDFVRGLFAEQVHLGNAVGSWFDHASGVVEPEALAEQVASLHAERPDLLSTWLVSVRHLRSAGRMEEATARAREMSARFPLEPIAWVERALCGDAAGDRADARSALERAVEINPYWSRAPGELSELLEREGELDRAREVLERARARAPREPGIHARLAMLAWGQGKRDEALSHLEDALSIEPNYEFGWSRYDAYSAEADARERARAFARALAGKRGGCARAWLALAQLLDMDAAEEALEALRRAIDLEAVLVEAHDARARILGLLGHYDEALAACRPAAFGDDTPVPLLGRAAWLEAKRGDVPRAMERMRAAVEGSPDYLWGHLQLYEWHAERSEHAEALAAARKVVELAPQDADAHVRLGNALRETGAIDAAREQFQEALRIDRAHEWAGLSLADLELSRERLDAAAEALESHDSTSPFVAARLVQVAAKRGRLADAQKHLPHALRRPGGNPWPMNAAIEAMEARGWRAAVADTAAAWLEADPPDADLAEAWGRTVSPRLVLSRTRFRRAAERGTAGVAALATFVERMGTAPSRLAVLALVVLHAATLRAHTALWGSLGYALLTLNRFSTALRWISDWRSRAGAQAWMLSNAATVYLVAGRLDESREAFEAALALPADGTRKQIAVGAAWHAALGGDFARAESLLADAGELGESWDKYLADLARALIACRDRSDLDVAIGLTRRAMGHQPGWGLSLLTRRAMRATRRRIAQRVRKPKAWLWWLLGY